MDIISLTWVWFYYKSSYTEKVAKGSQTTIIIIILIIIIIIIIIIIVIIIIITTIITLLEMSCPWVENRQQKEEEKTLKYAPLRMELKRQYPGFGIKQVNIVIIYY